MNEPMYEQEESDNTDQEVVKRKDETLDDSRLGNSLGLSDRQSVKPFSFGFHCGFPLAIIYLAIVARIILQYQLGLIKASWLPYLGLLTATLPSIYSFVEYIYFEKWAEKAEEPVKDLPDENLERQIIMARIKHHRERLKYLQSLTRNIWGAIILIVISLIIKGGHE